MDTVHECDRQTERQTDGQTDRITITKTVQRRASHGKNVIVTDRADMIFEVTKFSKIQIFGATPRTPPG